MEQTCFSFGGQVWVNVASPETHFLAILQLVVTIPVSLVPLWTRSRHFLSDSPAKKKK